MLLVVLCANRLLLFVVVGGPEWTTVFERGPLQVNEANRWEIAAGIRGDNIQQNIWIVTEIFKTGEK